MAEYTKHHYVPRFLLERWHSGADEKLTAFHWARGKLLSNRYKAKTVGKTPHLYSLERSRPIPNVEVEKRFLGPHVDDPAARVHAKIVASGVRSLSDEEKLIWSRFIVSLMLRVPRMVQKIRSHGRNVLAAGLDESPEEYLAARGDSPEATLRLWVEKNAPDLLDDLGVRTLPRLVYSEKLNGRVLGAKWATLPISGRFDLLISDHPLFLSGGLGTDFLLALPISPLLLYCAFKNDATYQRLLTLRPEALARSANESTLAQAEIYAFATGASQEPFVRKHLRRQALARA